MDTYLPYLIQCIIASAFSYCIIDARGNQSCHSAFNYTVVLSLMDYCKIDKKKLKDFLLHEESLLNCLMQKQRINFKGIFLMNFDNCCN